MDAVMTSVVTELWQAMSVLLTDRCWVVFFSQMEVGSEFG